MKNEVTAKVDLSDLVSALVKFQEWQAEYADIVAHRRKGDAVDDLMELLGIPNDNVSCLIGGSNAPIFKKAAQHIIELGNQLDQMAREQRHGCTDATCQECDR